MMTNTPEQFKPKLDDAVLVSEADAAIEAFQGTIDLITTKASEKVTAQLTRFGRLIRLETVIDDERFNDIKPSIEQFVGKLARGAFKKGYEAASALTHEQIEEATDFSLAMTFPELAINGFVSPSVHDERERLSEQYNESNVLTSFFTDENGTIQLGLFIRRPEE